MAILTALETAKTFIDLHFFGADDLVNGTVGYINANTGVVTSFSGNDTLTPGMKTYYNTELLENARTQQIYTQFGKKQTLPRNKGNKVEWRKWNTIDKAMVPLQEGVTPTGQKLGQTSLEVNIVQHGDYVEYTDVISLHYVDDVILGATEELGDAGGRTLDTLTRNELMIGTYVAYADKVTSGGTTTPQSRYALTKDSKLTPTMVNKAFTALKKQKAPTINGKYVAIIHPSVTFDLREDKDWIKANEYAGSTRIFNGEIGELHNVRFVESTEAPVYVGDPLNGDTARYLSVTAYTDSGSGTASTGGGTATAYQLTVSETPSLDLVGREILIEDTSSDGALEHAVISGVNTSSKYIFLKAAPTMTPASGDFLNPGEGGAENHTDNVPVAVYATLFLGKDAYGTIDADGAGMEMIIKPLGSGGTSDPLNQRGTIGYKFSTATKILYQERMLRVESCSAYSDVDEAQ